MCDSLGNMGNKWVVPSMCTRYTQLLECTVRFAQFLGHLGSANHSYSLRFRNHTLCFLITSAINNFIYSLIRLCLNGFLPDPKRIGTVALITLFIHLVWEPSPSGNSGPLPSEFLALNLQVPKYFCIAYLCIALHFPPCNAMPS